MSRRLIVPTGQNNITTDALLVKFVELRHEVAGERWTAKLNSSPKLDHTKTLR